MNVKTGSLYIIDGKKGYVNAIVERYESYDPEEDNEGTVNVIVSYDWDGYGTMGDGESFEMGEFLSHEPILIEEDFGESFFFY